MREIADISAPFVQSAAPLRAVFVMDDELLRHGLMHVLGQASGIRFVGDLHHGNGLADRLAALRPQLLLVGDEPGLDIRALLADLETRPRVVVVIDSTDQPAAICDLLHSGADGVVDRRSPSAELLGTILRVAAGHGALDARSTSALIGELHTHGDVSGPASAPALTRREGEVLHLLTDGLDNRAIAAMLFISEATVKFHLHNIMDKFGVHKRAALVSAALRGPMRFRTPGGPR